MLDTLTADQRARLRQQLDEMDAMENQSAQAAEEAVSQDFAESYTPQREYIDQAAQLLNQTEQASGQSSGIDPYAGQDNSFLNRKPQGVIMPEDETLPIEEEITPEQREFLSLAWPIS